MCRVLCGCGLVAALSGSALAELSSSNYSDFSEVQARIVGGLDFAAHADHDALYVSRADPAAVANRAFDLWNNGVPHAFKVVYNAGGIAGIAIDDLYTIESPVTIDPATNGILVSGFAADSNIETTVSNLKLTLPYFDVHDVPGSVAATSGDEYLLITTDLPLTGGFILSGQVTFRWNGAPPDPQSQWFDVTTVVISTPAAALLGVLGLVVVAAALGRRSVA